MALKKNSATLDGQPIVKLAIPFGLRSKIQELAKQRQVSIWGLIAVSINHVSTTDGIDWKKASRDYPTARQGQLNRWKQLEARVLAYLSSVKGATVERVVAGVNQDGEGPDISVKQAQKVLDNWVRSGKAKEGKNGRYQVS